MRFSPPVSTDAATRCVRKLTGLLFSLAWVAAVQLAWPGARGAEPAWSPEIARALDSAGTNRPALIQALSEVPPAQRPALEFLIQYMPKPDLETLSSSFLLENVALATESFEKAPWRDQVPHEIFLNDVLPYASVTERRDAWRKPVRDIAAPLIEGCKTPGEAAQKINAKIFGIVKVRYSTGRKRADQSPMESMESGIATCTGLSVLLVDACRAVGVPARVAGTPLWANKRGNHTWVEVWDNGRWHFTGAAEQDPNGLNRGWFTHDASQAKKDIPEHAIYASSYRPTGISFPMVWAQGVNWVPAFNVTDNYVPQTATNDASRLRLLVKVLDRPAGQRIAVPVTVTDPADAAVRFEGRSRDESADMNDILPFAVARGRKYEVVASVGGRTLRQEFTAGTNTQELVVLTVNEAPSFLFPSMACYAPPSDTGPLKARDEDALRSAMASYFQAHAEKQAAWKFPSNGDRWLKRHEPTIRRLAWEAYKSAAPLASLRTEFAAHEVRFESHRSPYTIKTVGVRPTNGWALFIAMHGGGGVAKEVNDQQWEKMQGYYRDHPESGGYLYVALRAPNDSWNGFYDTYVYPLVANLVRQFVTFGDVDSNKVFLMGYSHGGYGAFAIGPKMPDRFAAIHASGAAPTDGETSAHTLRNTLFTYMIGGADTDHGRAKRCQAFDESVRQIRGTRKDIYPVVMQFIPDHGHRGLPDRDKIVDMYPAVRHPAPPELSWWMTDTVIRDFYWLETDAPSKGQEIEATCRDNRVVIRASTNVTSLAVHLDARLVDLEKPVTFEVNGETWSQKVQPSLRVLCESLERRGDPELAFPVRVDVLGPRVARGPADAPKRTAALRNP